MLDISDSPALVAREKPLMDSLKPPKKKKLNNQMAVEGGGRRRSEDNLTVLSGANPDVSNPENMEPTRPTPATLKRKYSMSELNNVTQATPLTGTVSGPTNSTAEKKAEINKNNNENNNAPATNATTPQSTTSTANSMLNNIGQNMALVNGVNDVNYHNNVTYFQLAAAINQQHYLNQFQHYQQQQQQAMHQQQTTPIKYGNDRTRSTDFSINAIIGSNNNQPNNNQHPNNNYHQQRPSPQPALTAETITTTASQPSKGK